MKGYEHGDKDLNIVILFLIHDTLYFTSLCINAISGEKKSNSNCWQATDAGSCISGKINSSPYKFKAGFFTFPAKDQKKLFIFRETLSFKN
jgi:hypothetical protein